MHFTSNRENLLKTLGRVIGAVEKKATMPILSHIHVSASGSGTVTLCATDLEVSATGECVADVFTAGTCLILADRLKASLANIDDEDVRLTLSADEAGVTLEGGVVKYVLPALPAAEFPAVNQDNPHFCSLSPGMFPRLLKAVSHAVCKGGRSCHLEGVHVEADVKAARLIAVGTDGHRLSVAAVGYPDACEFGGALTLPTKACGLVTGIVGTIALHRGGQTLDFAYPSGNVGSRILEGEFPTWRRVVPAKHANYIVVRRESLIAAAEAAGVVADGEAKSVKLEADGVVLTISALGQTGTCNVNIPCQIEGDGTLEQRVNGRYLLQALQSLEGEEVFIKWGGASDPLLIIPVDLGAFEERLEVVMPMRG